MHQSDDSRYFFLIANFISVLPEHIQTSRPDTILCPPPAAAQLICGRNLSTTMEDSAANSHMVCMPLTLKTWKLLQEPHCRT